MSVCHLALYGRSSFAFAYSQRGAQSPPQTSGSFCPVDLDDAVPQPGQAIICRGQLPCGGIAIGKGTCGRRVREGVGMSGGRCKGSRMAISCQSGIV